MFCEGRLHDPAFAVDVGVSHATFGSADRPSLAGQLHQAVMSRLDHGFGPFGSVANLLGDVEGDLRVTVAVDLLLPLEIVILSLVVLAARQQSEIAYAVQPQTMLGFCEPRFPIVIL
jgi:hypothetical protein